jgi:glycosyl transferase, family 25
VKIVVINLERSRERRETMAANLGQLGLEFEFFTGVDGAKGEHHPISRYNQTTALLDYETPMHAGEIAVYASHYLVWKRCAEGQEPVLIMEDDVMITPEFPAAVAAAGTLIGELGLIRLALSEELFDFTTLRELGGGLRLAVYARGGTVGTQAYALSPRAAARLVRTSDCWSLPLDIYVDRYRRHGLKSYAIHPFAARHIGAACPTTIGRDAFASDLKEQIPAFRLRRRLRQVELLGRRVWLEIFR